MKLLSCVIQGFGKFKSVKIDFNEGLTCICEDNGYGKTTLAAFLKAMFYGMDSSTKKSKFNDRTHYLPFDSGAYGGVVIFEYGGIKYRIKRTFDSSSSTKDTYELSADRDNAPFLADPIGEKIFGIDRDSFERTIFITSQEIDLNSTDSIKTKLNNFVEGTSDDTNLQQAIKKLEGRAKDYSYKSGKGGLIYEEKCRADKIRSEIANRDKISASLQGKYTRLNDLDRQIADLGHAVSAAQTENTLRADWEHYDELVGNVNAAAEGYNGILDRYPYGVPEVADISDARKAIAACETECAVLEKKTFTEQDEADLAALTAKFQPAPPNEKQLDLVSADVHAVQDADVAIAGLMARTPTETETALKKRFDGRLPEDSALEALGTYEAQYKEADEAYSTAPDVLAASAGAKFGKFNIMLLIIAAVVLVAGIGVCFAQLIAGIVLIVVGLIVAVLDCFLYLNKKSSSQHSAGALNASKLSYKDKRDEAANRIGAIIMPYGYSFEGGVLFGASSFKKDFNMYLEYAKEDAVRTGEIRTNQQSRETKAATLRLFFRRYGIEGDAFADNLAAIRDQINRYNTLRERRNSSQKSEESTRDSMQKHFGFACDFCNRYGLPSDTVENIKEALAEAEEDSRRFSGYKEAYQNAAAKANDFKAHKNLVSRPEGISVDIEELNAEISSVSKERSQLALEINSAEKDIETKQSLNNDLEESTAKIARYSANYDIIVKTRDALKAADDRLKDKYANPISGSFAAYENALRKSTGEKIYMTRDLTVRFEHAGEERGEEYLSSGQRAACALCYRLAILDNMYSGEKPFLILDDPFSTMDAAHFASSKALLLDLSRTFQIIYLTCHESRMII
ncbi:MAG: AAA family ATPase [Clostridia bacterium]|nr:AAA family ATPase [Clostridia bacterium]